MDVGKFKKILNKLYEEAKAVANGSREETSPLLESSYSS